MPPPTKTLEQFQQYIWDSLPPRKHMLGKEVVFDVVAIVVQEWPDEVLSATKSGDTGEIVAATELAKTVKRHLSLTYGEQKFGTFWIIALQILLPVLIDLVMKWWRRRKDHQGRLRIWRRKWVNGTADE